MGWQKAVTLLSRASGRYADAVSKVEGDRAEAARLMWAMKSMGQVLP